MSVVSTMLRQRAIYWAPAGTNGDGTQRYAHPVQLRCRWEDSDRMVLTATNEMKRSSARVFVSALDGSVTDAGGDVVPRGMLVRGLLTSSTPPSPAGTVAKEIGHFEKEPDFRARHWLRTCDLI